MLKDGTMYKDLGRNHFDRRSADKQKQRLVKRLAELSYVVEIKPLAAYSRVCGTAIKESLWHGPRLLVSSSRIVVGRFRFGATMVLGRSGRPMMTSASPGRGGGGRAQRATGSSTTIAKFRGTDSGAALRLLTDVADSILVISVCGGRSVAGGDGAGGDDGRRAAADSSPRRSARSTFPDRAR
jgi:hypothetical protein